MEVFVKSDLDLDGLAQRVRELLNIPETNRSEARVDQRRDGLNWGGLYYLFETFGLVLRLLSNEGEVEIEEMADYPFYIVVQDPVETDDQTLGTITQYLSEVLRHAGLESVARTD